MKKRAIGSLVLVSAMAMGSTSVFAADATKNADGKYDPEITITIGKQLDENTGRYGDGEDINKNPMTELTRESLGINMETTLLGGDASNYETKLRLALTSSDDLPDVFPVYSAQLAADMIESGMVKDITDDITNLMPDRLKEIYDQYPNTYSTVTKDGKIYGMAVSPHLTEGEVMIIRQDWLDNLGLEAPTTIDEFEEVIRAFTEDDPDGNGEKDTYGFTYEGDTIYNNGWCADPVTIFSVYTGKNLPGQWQEDEDGKLVYGSLDEGNKKALERLAKWHANGWTFQEAAATGAWDAMSWLMFNKNFNNMEAFFEYYDWAYNPAFGTDGFKYGYLDGYDYQIQGDKVVFDSNLFDPPVADAFMPGKSTVFKNSPGFSAMEAYAAVRDGKEPETGAEIRAAAHFESSYNCAEGYAIANDYKEYQNPSLFKAAPTASMSKYWEQLQTMEKQVYTNIIYGNESIDAFDKFVEDWYAQGGDKITEEVNEWYQSVK